MRVQGLDCADEILEADRDFYFCESAANISDHIAFNVCGTPPENFRSVTERKLVPNYFEKVLGDLQLVVFRSNDLPIRNQFMVHDVRSRVSAERSC